jgi:hypothetical protein
MNSKTGKRREIEQTGREKVKEEVPLKYKA